MKSIICTICLVLLAGCQNHKSIASVEAITLYTGHASTVDYPTYTMETITSVEKWVKSSLERGVFHKVKIENNQVWMSERIWNQIDGTMKTKALIFLSHYFESKNGTKKVIVLDVSSGKILGEYAEFGRIEIYE